jgi:hypothetical protein
MIDLLYSGPTGSNFLTRTSVILRNMVIPAFRQGKLPDIPILAFNDYYVTFTFGMIQIRYPLILSH